MSSKILRHLAAMTEIFDRSRPHIEMVEKLLTQIESSSLHPQVSPLKTTLQDFISGAPARTMVLAYDGNHKIVGALTYVDNKDEQEIKSLGVVQGDNTARSLIRSLNHQKTLSVSASTTEHDLYDKLGFQHSEELEEGEPSLMIKAPPQSVVASKTASGIVQKAREFARKAHEDAGQLRKYTKEPYIIHPDRVVDLLKEFGALSDNILAAAYLHDTVEDTSVSLEDIEREFGSEIASLVEMLTDTAKPEDGNRAARMLINQGHSALGSPDAQTIKVADIIDNIRDISLNDPKFARTVYLPEKEAMLNVLTKANPTLLAKAMSELEKAKGSVRTARVEYDLEDTDGSRQVKIVVDVNDSKTTKWEVYASPMESGFSAEIKVFKKDGTQTGTMVFGDSAHRLERDVLRVVDQWYGTRDEASSSKVRSELLAGLAGAFRTDAPVKPKMRFASRILASPTVMDAPVAEVAEEAGAVIVYLGESTIEGNIIPELQAFDLDSIWVKPSQRNQGVGQLLMLKLAEFLKSKGVKYIIGTEVNADKIPTILRNKIPNSKTVHLEGRENPESPSAEAVFEDLSGNMQEFLRSFTPDPNGELLVTKIASVIARVHSNLTASYSKSVYASRIIKAYKFDDTNAGTTYYHGTDSEAAAQQIMQVGIQPKDVVNPDYRGRGWLAPPKGRIYITPNLGYAAIYALGGNVFGSSHVPGIEKGSYGYIFEVSGKDLAGDVQPDEDYIGEALYYAWAYSDAVKRLANIQNGSNPRSGSEVDNLNDRIEEMGRQPINSPANEATRLDLIQLAKAKLTDGQMKRLRHGEYAEWARSGKKLQKCLPDYISKAMLSWGAHVSHSGTVMPTRAWKFKKEDAQSIKSGSEVMQICTEVPLASPEKVARRIYASRLFTKGTDMHAMSHQAAKKIATEMSMLYCTNSECPDFEKTNHGNLTQEFSYGVESDRHIIYCTTCKKRFSETKCTEFFGTKLSSEEISSILAKTVDGMSIRDIADDLDLNKDTVNGALLKAKEVCENYIKNKSNPKVTTEMMGDMDLPKGDKADLHEFITEVVIPGLDEDKGKDEPKESSHKESRLVRSSKFTR